ncbi:hypothetical protein pipiens_009668 [Culex pipiens pipiens]|uniref:Uncharacterized protein n=1 Tax=Culex pipiens pipiens TaxID=38569 RepID=A0ABD1DGK6_CULPP
MKFFAVCLAALAVLALEVCSNEVEVAGDDLPQTDQLKLASFSSRVAEAVIPATSGKRSADNNVWTLLPSVLPAQRINDCHLQIGRNNLNGI